MFSPGAISDSFNSNLTAISGGQFLTSAMKTHFVSTIINFAAVYRELLDEPFPNNALGVNYLPQQFWAGDLQVIYYGGLDYEGSMDGIVPEDPIPPASRSFMQYPPGLYGPGLQSKVIP